MKGSSLLLFISLAFSHLSAQQNEQYQFTLDLVHVNDDKVSVELIAPVIKQTEIVYNIPKIVPGTYSEDNFGRFIEDFAAFDKKGRPLLVTRLNTNSWKISKARSLYKISYRVNDTFDDSSSTSKKVFEPTGSNIQQDTNFVINTHCFLGYFDGKQQQAYSLTIIHPPFLYGSTSMQDEDNSNSVDKFTTENYNRMVDNPIMYDVPDTANIRIGNCQVLISVYSPNKKVSAPFIADKFGNLLQAIAKYLGGTLPVNKYAFLLYLTDHGGVSGEAGALEHSYSSMYFMPEGDPQNIIQFFIDDASHEFFHIITPLSIHSEEIQYFNFNTPKMSKHLWLYEGSTEYHARLVQEKYGLITKEAFLDAISQKITNSRQGFNDTLPFTEMSSKCLHEFADQYLNVYEKGALIAMCIDIKLRQLSGGKYGLIQLVEDLSRKYGKDKPFKDDELFDEIGKMTFSEIRDFLDTYVSGNKPLPLEQLFTSAGIDFTPETETRDSVFTLGGLSLSISPESGKVMINSLGKLNEFGKQLGYHVNDEFQMINGKDVSTPANFNKVFNEVLKDPKSGDTLTIMVNRKNDSGAPGQAILSALMVKTPVRKYNQLRFMPSPTPDQLSLQNSWLNSR